MRFPSRSINHEQFFLGRAAGLKVLDGSESISPQDVVRTWVVVCSTGWKESQKKGNKFNKRNRNIETNRNLFLVLKMGLYSVKLHSAGNYLIRNLSRKYVNLFVFLLFLIKS